MLISVIRPIPAICVDFVAKHEAEGGVPALTAYPDPGTGGAPWTIGYGSTAGVYQGMTITPEDARSRLTAGLEEAARRFEVLVGGPCVQELTVHQYSAMLSFVYNVKVNPKDHIWQYLREQHFDLIPGELIKFVNAAGKKMQGLVNRRTDEIRLWATDEPGIIKAPVTTAALGDGASPPTPGYVKPLPKSKSWWASWTSAGLASAAAAAPQVKSGVDGALAAVSPYVGQSEVLQAITSHLALVAALAAASVPALLWLKNHQAKQ